MWNWVWGLKSLVCSESMHVLARLLIVQPDHTYANALSWSQSIERITASIRHTERLYTGPYNHSVELRASGKERKCFSFSPHHHSKTRERKRESSHVLLHRCFWVIFKDLFLPNAPLCTLIGYSFLVNIWWYGPVSLRHGERPRGVVFRSSARPLFFFYFFLFVFCSLLLARSRCKLQRTGCDRRRRFVWNSPQFRGKRHQACVCKCVKR